MADISFRIERMKSESDVALTIKMFTAYARSLKIDLGFQDFEAELASFPAKYAPPAGAILLARTHCGDPLGCVAIRPLIASCCEMKRLYVAPEGRGLGLGRALVTAIIKEAEQIGYKTMRLDTLSTMTEAIRLYRRQGFVDIEAYYDTPIAGTVFMQRQLGLDSQLGSG
ncbi:MAG: hypothetical protein Q9195_007081 [Heterodermia aff. obscurata]